MRLGVLASIGLGIAITGCGSPMTVSKVETRSALPLVVHCGAFSEGKPIAQRHSGYLDNVSPSLTWQDAPSDTQAYAILVEDTDAPGSRPFVHWVVANIPGDVKEIPEAIPTEPSPSYLKGAIQGMNDMGKVGYFGPKPEAGPAVHHYHFRVFALDSKLPLKEGFDPPAFLAAASGHVLAQGETTGTFERK